jgi:diguanylate cyclase (GGDEF)-like protein
MECASVSGRGSGAKAVGLDLKTLLSLGSGLLISTLVVILSFVIEPAATRQIERRIGSELQELAFQMHDKLHRGLSERLHDIRLAATLGAFADRAAPRRTKEALLHWLRHIYPEYTWIGLVDAMGEVVAHTDSTGPGANLAHEAWFRGGLRGPYLGAMLASPALPSMASSQPKRIVDLAAPIIDDGDVVGVLGAYLSWTWAEDVERSLLAPLRQRRGTELFVLNANGVVVLGSPDLIGKRLDVASVRAAQAGSTGYTVASWPDGKTYVTGFTAGARDAQNSELEWLVLARQDAVTALDPIVDLQRHLLVWGATTGFVFVLLAWFGAKWIAAPLRALTAAADQLERGGDSQRLPVSARYAEVASLSSSLAALLARLRQNELRFRTLALRDPLTGLPNRVLLRDRLRQAVAHSRRTKRPAALLILDLDHFKDVNDTLGHPTGDRLLTEAARRLTTCLRETDTVARLGGDEFALIVFELQHADDATIVARKVVAELAKPFQLDGQDVHVGASVGIAICDADGSDPDQLLRHADLALYSAKASGGRACHFFVPAMAAEVVARKGLERDLRQAFETGMLELHFQPELDLRSGCLRGAEALLRWRQRDRGWVSPGKFIPVAEASGLIGTIGAWALRQACRQAKVWRETGLPALTVAVNVSLTQCRRADLAATVETALQEAGLPPEALELEVTESVFLREDDETVLTQLRRLRAIGVAVAIDDFGTGYSSLGRLRALPVDKVKIDRSFIARLGQETGADTIVRAIVALGHGLGLHVTAEGVENESQLRFLRSADCDGAQGFLVGRPAPGKGALWSGLVGSEPAIARPWPASSPRKSEPLGLASGEESLRRAHARGR